MKKILKITLLLFINSYLFLNTSSLHADTTTIIYPQSVLDLWWTAPWINTSNVLWNDTNISTDNNNLTQQATNSIAITNFNFANEWLPSDANINWITVDIEWSVSWNNLIDSIVQLTTDWTTSTWSNYALWTNWPTTKTITTYWSSTDLWWTSITANEILSTNFWVILQYNNPKKPTRSVSIYRVWITIDYTVNPGWVSWTSFWLRADKWTSTTISWNALNTWTDQSWNWYDATAWTAPIYLYNDTNNINFNPYIDFDGSTQYMENLNNWAYSHSYYMVIIPDNQVDWTLNAQTPFWLDCDSWILNTWTCWLTFAWTTLWAFTVAMNDEVVTHAIWASTWRRSAQIWAYSYNAEQPMLLWFNENSWVTWTDIYEKWVKIDNYTVNTYQNLSTADYSLWRSMDSDYYFYYNWKIAEIIDFTSRISDWDRNKIESYLSLKYWITLNNWTQNYTASNWTTIFWNNSTAWTYIYDIFWIARDDSTSLSQIKSKSSNNDWIITIEAIWEWNNLTPSFVDMNDLEALVISNNNSWNYWTVTNSPSGYTILSRLWKVQETWEVWTINISFDVGNTNFDIPSLSSWTSYYFIYDSDNDSSLTDETPLLMTNSTWNIWTSNWIDLDNWQIFTIASEAWTNNIPTDIYISSNNINENVSSWSLIWYFSTTDVDIWDSHTYTFVWWDWDDNNSNFSITWSGLYITYSPDYELKSTYSIRVQTDDWNWWTYQKAFIIYINNLAEDTDSIIDFEEIDDESKYYITSWTWTRTTTNPYEWSYSIESNNWWVGNSQSCFQITNTFSATWTVSFYYSVSSELNWDYLHFYIDNIEQWNWSGDVAFTNYAQTDIEAWEHIYKWCYIKNATIESLSDTARIDYITFNSEITDLTPPTITSNNYSSWTLLPWWNHDLIITYNDSDSWIDTSSDTISLYKWNWSTWWSDISSTWIDLASKTITTTSAIYPTNNLSYWKYYYDFEISDNAWNSSSTWITFYIDEVELIINTWSLDIWELEVETGTFSTLEFDITVKTVWAWFDLLLNTDSNFSYSWVTIQAWDWTEGFWYDKSPYTSTINLINNPETIATQAGSINIDWNQNSYNYLIKFWAKIDEEQAAWNYEMDVRFGVDMDY